MFLNTNTHILLLYIEVSIYIYWFNTSLHLHDMTMCILCLLTLLLWSLAIQFCHLCCQLQSMWWGWTILDPILLVCLLTFSFQFIHRVLSHPYHWIHLSHSFQPFSLVSSTFNVKIYQIHHFHPNVPISSMWWIWFNVINFSFVWWVPSMSSSLSVWYRFFMISISSIWRVCYVWVHWGTFG